MPPYKFSVKKILRLALVLYTLCLLYWMFVGFGRTTMHQIHYNLIPFDTIRQYFVNFHKFAFTTWIINIGGNIGVFMPLGLCIPYLLNISCRRFLSWFIIVLFAVELMQMITKRGSFDVDDIVLNSTGALLGYICFVIFKRLFPRKNDRHNGKMSNVERN